MRKYFSLTLFLLIPLAAGSIIGAATAPGQWYAGLVKPWFNPPGWIFGPVWSILYVMIGPVCHQSANENGLYLGFGNGADQTCRKSWQNK